MTDFRATILKAAEEGRISVADLPDGDDFESVSEWLEYAADCDIEDAALDAGLASDERPDIHEINRRQAENLARDNGIGRFGKYPR